jgi:DNA mismatch endonuclease, patch repair protein
MTSKSIGLKKPQASSPAVRRFMSSLRTVGTEPEWALRRELHRRGLRYRVNVRTLPGCPDIALTRARIAIFVDGCFWHGCPKHAVAPKSNAEWWRSKLEANVVRDRRNDATLREAGWIVVRAWEHDSKNAVADVIEQVWVSRLGRWRDTQHAELLQSVLSGHAPQEGCSVVHN